MAIVASMAEFVGGDDFGGGLRLLKNTRREAVWQVVLSDHDFDVDAEVVGVAEYFDDATAGILRGAGPVGDFYIDDHAFQVAPAGATGGFFAEDAVWRVVRFDFFICRQSGWILVALGDDDFL